MCIYIYFKYKIVYSVYRGFLVSFAQRGTVVPCPPISIFLAPFYPVCLLCLWWLVVVGGCMCWMGLSAGWVVIVIPGVLT